ncbi:alginate O-acetyltransferase AlgX-related protein [Janthinobacterium fluminis]|uniref:Twin-arginine translocation pathway signal n=1 Tax=Janthinobacterium fluminis TaxID=2987524 RepID=A0ABT5K1Z5_9BURK|nr:twin-arginine translocation pathway signal [Janthinobacterium fluminis]MDC8758291.1 twin-arginine translocation pathway signal [Janthinobacterium fluminis]
MMSHTLISRCGAAALLLALAAPQSARADASVIVGKDGWLFPAWENLSKSDQPALRQSVELIRGVHERLGGQRIGLLVLVAPMKAGMYPERLPPGMALGADVRARYPHIQALLSQAGIASVDDLAVLKGVEQGSQTAFYRADYHWTAWSSEASAAAAGELIARQWPLQGKPGTASELGEWTSERRFGDLAANFMSAEQRKAIGRDVFVVRAPAATRAGLLDAAPAQVHVVGNSFVQPYFGFPQKLSNVIDRPVSVTWNVGNVGPWQTMLEYLESPQFAEHKPQVIVWQLNEGQLQFGPNALGRWDAKSLMPPEVWRARVAKALP